MFHVQSSIELLYTINHFSQFRLYEILIRTFVQTK